VIHAKATSATSALRRALACFFVALAVLAPASACNRADASAGSSPPRGQRSPSTRTASAAQARRKIGISAAADPASIAALKRLGITRVRTGIIWRNYLDPRHFADDRSTPVGSGGHTPPEFFAMDMAAFAAAGIEPLVVVHTPPDGMTLGAGITAMPKFMAGLARRFRGMRWEILNEMNGDDAFNGGWFEVSNQRISMTTRGERYGRLLRPVYDSIKAADPSATVVTGGIDKSLTAFYKGMVATAAGKFDVFAVHDYGPPAAPGFVQKSEEMRPLLHGKPLWCTEVGNDQANEASQARDLASLLDDNDRNDRYDRVYLYTLIGDGNYGLVRPDGSLRQAARLLLDRKAP